MVKHDDVTFTATGVIDGPLLNGIVSRGNNIITHSIVLRGLSKTKRFITAEHSVA